MPVRVQLEREIDHRLELVEVLAVDDGVDGERQARRPDRPRHLELARMPLEPADPVGDPGLGALQRELHMIEPGLGAAPRAGADPAARPR